MTRVVETDGEVASSALHAARDHARAVRGLLAPWAYHRAPTLSESGTRVLGVQGHLYNIFCAECDRYAADLYQRAVGARQ